MAQGVGRSIFGVLAALALACHRPAPPSSRGGLDGLVLRLPEGALKLEGRGRVGDSPARVLLDVSAPLTTVTSGCFPAGPLPARATLRVPRPEGGFALLPAVRLPRAWLEDAEVGRGEAGLLPGEGCTLTLGSELLAAYALHLDPVRRELRLTPSRPREEYRSPGPLPDGGERFVVELSRDPAGDWLLLPARLCQEGAGLTGPFVLSTRQARSTLAREVAQLAGLRPQGARAQPAQAFGSSYLLDGLELHPGLVLEQVHLLDDAGWSNPGALGALGVEVWGRAPAILDPGAGVLVVSRLRGAEGATPLRCLEPEPADPELPEPGEPEPWSE